MIGTSTYSTEVKRAIQIAQALAREFQNENFSPAHLLKGLLHNDVGLASTLVSWGKDIHYLRDWADIRIAGYEKSTNRVEEPSGDEKVLAVLEVADVAKLKLSEDIISPLALLMAICRPGVAFSDEQLKTLPITEREILDIQIDPDTVKDAIMPSPSMGKKNGSGKTIGTKALNKFCLDKTAEAAGGNIDPIIGREAEIRTIAEILGRRTKPNVIVVGEPGVGKTALVDGFALDIVNGKVPANLKNAIIFELDMGSLIAGASYKGEIEERLKSILREIKQFEKAILFIDEIHILLDPAGGAGGAANLLKPELARGAITVIGATTMEEYREFIETDDAFRRRFEELKVPEPDVITTTRMLQTLMPYYTEHHQINIEPKAIPEAVRLAKRYIKDRRLPDAAIDLVDRTMAAIRMMGETSFTILESLEEELKPFDARNSKLSEEDLRTELLWLYDQLKSRISPILLGMAEEEEDPAKFSENGHIFEHIQALLKKLKPIARAEKQQVEPQDIAAVVAHRTGIPLGKIQSKEREKLLKMEDHLKKRVVGQDHALNILGEAVRISRAGLVKSGLPIGSFFFLGPTGTGKTELAKTLAEFLFNDERSLIRFDMSEFKEEHSAALLYGAPPGYVGYKEGGLLVNKIRQQPYAIVLFDEIEKAHSSVFDIFLQILDEGKLTDKLGKEGDFSNAIILFTSNIGSEHIEAAFSRGEIPKSDDLREIMGRFFRPEFLGRLTEVVPFAPIAAEVVELIFKIQLKGLLKTLEHQGIQLELDEKALKKLADEGFDPKFGARPIRSVIRNRLQRPISRMIISKEVQKGQTINVKLDKDEQLIFETA